MTAHGHSHGKQHRKPAHSGPKPIRSDAIVYIAVAMVGPFATPLISMVTGWGWKPIAVGYVAAVAILINFCGLKACFLSNDLSGWQQAMARIPLRFVGYGSEKGKPLSAARSDPRARTALIGCFLICVTVVGGLGLLLIR